MKKAVCLCIALLLFTSVITYGQTSTMAVLQNGDTAAEKIFAEFEKLSAIPRKSKYEKVVSDYIVSRLKEIGLNPVQDQNNNVIVEKPASKGYEMAPRTILQAHMDMVCVAAEDVEFNPLTDSIKIVRDGNRVYADGTSLGADDGIGVSILLSILSDDSLAHGPLRAIFTVDEEVDMMGAAMLDAKYLDGKYLINVDWEDSASVCTSSADTSSIDVSLMPEWSAPEKGKAFTMEVKGLLGGHSGLEINKGRANAIKITAGFLQALSDGDISYELSEISGGAARNSIPATAKAIFTVNEADAAKALEIFGAYREFCIKGYNDIEKAMSLTLIEAPIPSRVMKNGGGLIEYLVALPANVHTMSPIVDGLVESSSNTGIIKTTDEKIEILIFTRSSSEFFSRDIVKSHEIIAKRFGLQFKLGTQSPGWKQRASSDVVPVLQKVYKEQTGEDFLITPIHAGLECGWFANKNPDLDIVSIGPKIDGAHSTEETLYYDSISVTFNLLVKTLENLK